MICPYTFNVNLLGLLFKQLIQHTFQGPHRGHWVSEAILCPYSDWAPKPCKLTASLPVLQVELDDLQHKDLPSCAAAPL